LSMCQVLRVDYAKKVLRKMKKSGFTASSLVLSNLALAYALRGQFEDAIQILSKVDENTPKGKAPDTEAKPSQVLFEQLQMEEVKSVVQLLNKFLASANKVKPRTYSSMSESPQVKFMKDVGAILDFKTIFESLSKGRRKSSPVKIEVCAGSGEWITNRALKEPNSNWVSLDIRHDRVFQTWSKAVLNNLSNILVLSGEANSVFTNNINSESVDEVIINFPEPPAMEGSQQHLITTSFLAQIYRVLKDKGILIALTDNKPYSTIISKAVSQFKDRFESVFPQQFDTSIPADYGSSYFDRFWNKGTLTNRYFFKYYKK